MQKLAPLPIVLITLLGAPASWAGEGLFSRVYTTETVPGGHYELEQTIRNRRDRAFGSYSAFDFKTEFEYGITDNFQGAFYLNTGHMSANGSPDDDDPNGATGFSRSNTYVESIAFEFVYRVLSPISDPIGLAFYLEPEFNFYDIHNGLRYDKSMGTEWRVLLQKNFLEDQLVVVFNLGAEFEFIRFVDGDRTWAGELDWNNEFGASYRVASNWYAGIEFRNHNEFGDFTFHEHSVFWAGVALHYGGPTVWGTLGVLKQIGGNPNGFDENGTFIGDGKFLRSHENWEITAKVGLPF